MANVMPPTLATVMPPIHAWLEEGEDMLDKSLLCDGATRIVVASRIGWRFTDFYIFNNPIFNNKHKTLAPDVAKNFLWTRMINAHANSLRELTPGVGQESNHRAFHRLILGPCLHYSTIVDTIDQNLIDSFGLELSLLRQIARNLRVGSAWSECSWQPHYDNFLAFRALCHVYLPGGEAMVDGNSRNWI